MRENILFLLTFNVAAKSKKKKKSFSHYHFFFSFRAKNLYRYTPNGAFYVMVDISSSGLKSKDFCLKLLKRKVNFNIFLISFLFFFFLFFLIFIFHSPQSVAVAPGDTFGPSGDSFVRVSIASSDEDVREGMTRICDFINECAAEKEKK